MSHKAAICLCIALVMSFSVACGMTAPLPSSDGQKGSSSVNMATHVITPISQTFPNVESVWTVTAQDGLQVRPCPYKEDLTCPPYEYGLPVGSVVMGSCQYFEDGSIWLAFDEPVRYSAVYFDGIWLMEGSCQ